MLSSNIILPGRSERGVHQSFVRQIGHALDLVEVKRIFAGQRAVQTGLDVRGPVVSQYGLSAHIVLTHPGDPRVNPLQRHFDHRNRCTRIHRIRRDVRHVQYTLCTTRCNFHFNYNNN